MKLYEPTSDLKVCPEDVCTAVVDAAFVVHQYFGPGQFETIYRKALEREIGARGIVVESEVPVSVQWRGEDLGVGFRADLIVAESLVLELKAVDTLHPAHSAQLMGYLRLLRIKRGFLINFNALLLKEGIKRISI